MQTEHEMHAMGRGAGVESPGHLMPRASFTMKKKSSETSYSFDTFRLEPEVADVLRSFTFDMFRSV